MTATLSADRDPPPMELLHVDDHVVIVHKPAGAVVHPTRGALGSPVVTEMLRERLGGAVYPVHRLDRQTSGVMVLARTERAAAALCHEIREGRLRKSYLALCRGVVRESLTIDAPVLEEGLHRIALTDVHPLETFCDRYTLLRVRTATGRRHQIRRHLKHVDHPLTGDSTYGSGVLNRFFRETFGLGRLFLHAEWLRVLHPVEFRYLDHSAGLPADLQGVLDRLRAHTGPVV